MIALLTVWIELMEVYIVLLLLLIKRAALLSLNCQKSVLIFLFTTLIPPIDRNLILALIIHKFTRYSDMIVRVDAGLNQNMVKNSIISPGLVIVDFVVNQFLSEIMTNQN